MKRSWRRKTVSTPAWCRSCDHGSPAAGWISSRRQARAPWWLHEGAIPVARRGRCRRHFRHRNQRQPPGGNAAAAVPRAAGSWRCCRSSASSRRDDQALIAVPLPQTRIRTIPLAELRRRGASGDDCTLLSSLVASWIDVITRGMPHAAQGLSGVASRRAALASGRRDLLPSRSSGLGEGERRDRRFHGGGGSPDHARHARAAVAQRCVGSGACAGVREYRG